MLGIISEQLTITPAENLPSLHLKYREEEFKILIFNWLKKKT